MFSPGDSKDTDGGWSAPQIVWHVAAVTTRFAGVLSGDMDGAQPLAGDFKERAWDEIAHGVTTVITPQPWTAASAIALLHSERITVGQGVPTQWALVLAHPDLEHADVSSLRIAGTGASRVPPELVLHVNARS